MQDVSTSPQSYTQGITINQTLEQLLELHSVRKIATHGLETFPSKEYSSFFTGTSKLSGVLKNSNMTIRIKYMGTMTATKIHITAKKVKFYYLKLDSLKIRGVPGEIGLQSRI